MAKLLYSASMSVDGYITGPGGDMSWLTEYMGPDPMMDRIVQSIGALLMGNRTFGGDDPHKGTEHEGGAFGGGWSGPQFVVTHHPPATPVAGVTFVDDLADGITASKEAAGEKYVNILGADIARQCAEACVLDEVLVCIAPVMLGDGVRLLERRGGMTVRLERVRAWDSPMASNVWFRVVR